jgi:hypothetical protein
MVTQHHAHDRFEVTTMRTKATSIIYHDGTLAVVGEK